MITKAKKRTVIKSSGFSMLEIIIALAIVGIVMVTLATYARKMVDEKSRQVVADAVAQEVYGVLQFINADSINASVNNNTKRVTNPLYQSPSRHVYPDAADNTPDADLAGLTNNPVWLIHPHNLNSSLNATNYAVSPYIARSYSGNITSPVINDIRNDGGIRHPWSHSLKWSQTIWGVNSVRSYFTDSGCDISKTTGPVVYFNQQFLTCHENPSLRNSEIAISRIDFVNSKGSFSRWTTSPDFSVAIDRVDVYVSFRPVDGNPARIAQFISPLMTAFRTKKIMPNTDNIYLVRSQPGGNGNAWTLLNKTTGMPAGSKTPVDNLAMFTDLPNMIRFLQKNGTYGIRFTFDGHGDYLRTDGLNAATKLCWNTSGGGAGPCLTTPSTDSLVLKRRDNPKEFANLQVSSVISTASHDVKGKTVIDEYYTAPRIQYAVFSSTPGSQSPPPYYKNGDQLCPSSGGGCIRGVDVDFILDPAHGAISVPKQICENVVDREGKKVPMHPRLSASVSSVVSGIYSQGGSISPAISGTKIFDKQGYTINNLDKPEITINRLGGVVMQIRPIKTDWRIAGVVGIEDIKNRGQTWQYYNPPWLSVIVTSWCSSVPQP